MISPSDANYESFAGAARVKNVQIGFPVELTGVWDASTGYPWKRLMLSGVSVANASPIQMTGTNAVPIDGNTALTSGTKGWLEPDPGAAGYLFITADTSDSGVTGTGTDNRVVRWDGTSAIQDSYAVLNDSGALMLSDISGPSSTQRELTLRTYASGGSQAAALEGRMSGSGGTYQDYQLGFTANSTGNISTMFLGFGDATFGFNDGLTYTSPTNSGNGELFVGSDGAGKVYATTVKLGGSVAGTVQIDNRNVSGSIQNLVVSFGTDTAGYSATVAGVVRDGTTGTLAPGALFAGGICYDLGTGSFVGTATANTFTNTNTFTPASTSGVPVIARGLASQTGDLLQAQDSAATVRARIEPDGEIEAASGAARLNVSSSNGQLALYNNAGATYATLTAGASNVLTTSAGFTTGGALTVSSGGLTVTAGGANITGTVTAADGSGIAQLNASNLSSGTAPVAYGGTGTGSTPTNGQLLIGNGTGYTLATLTQPAAGLTITGGAGSVTFALANDLAALEALSGTNTIYYRSGADTWSAVTVGTGLSFSGGTLSSTAASGAVPNVLHNGGFEVWQRGTSVVTVGDGTYTADRWYLLQSSTASNTTVQRATGTTGARYALQFGPIAGSSRRCGVATVAEASDSIPYRGRSVRFQFKAKASSSLTLRFAILEWTGTADTVTLDVVNDWTSGTFTAGNFFVGSNVTVVATGSLAATTSFASASVTGTVSSSCNNLIAFVWSDAAMTTSDTFTVTECGFHDGTTARDWLPRSIAEELAICQRYFYARASGVVGIASNTSRMYSGGVERFPVAMRTAPTQSGATFSVNAGSAGTPAFTNTSGGYEVSNSAANWTTNAIVSLNGALFSADM